MYREIGEKFGLPQKQIKVFLADIIVNKLR